jgi:hypothetical protein
VKLKIRALTPDLWPQFEVLFGRTGACGGRWCLYWRIGSAYQNAPRETNNLEAYPVDTDEKKSSSTIYTGKASTFRRAGFNVVARRVPHRPMMRHAL